MKIKSSLLALALSAASVLSANAATTVAYWNFNNLDTPSATSGTGTLDVTEGAGTLTWSGASANLVYFAGTVTNMIAGDDRGLAFALQNGTSGVNNGSFLEFTLNLTNFEGLVMSFAAQRTTTGFNSAEVSYALGTGTFTDFFSIPTFESSMGTTAAVPASIRTVDFSSLDSTIAGESDVRIRITFDGGSTSSAAGNNRFDNIQFTAIPEPSSALLGGLGMLCLLRRRR